MVKICGSRAIVVVLGLGVLSAAGVGKPPVSDDLDYREVVIWCRADCVALQVTSLTSWRLVEGPPSSGPGHFAWRHSFPQWHVAVLNARFDAEPAISTADWRASYYYGRRWRLVVPGWLLAVFVVAPAGRGLCRTAARSWRRSRGRCARCGYDLRATPHRCPECGAPKTIFTMEGGSGTTEDAIRFSLAQTNVRKYTSALIASPGVVERLFQFCRL